jgi:hypothetical protein
VVPMVPALCAVPVVQPLRSVQIVGKRRAVPAVPIVPPLRFVQAVSALVNACQLFSQVDEGAQIVAIHEPLDCLGVAGCDTVKGKSG